MITRPMALASAMSLPTRSPSHVSAHAAVAVRRGSITYMRAPLRTPLSTWWKKIGWASRAFEPQRKITSVFSISSYELVPPPAPKTVARPTTLGACQVRLQLSMLLLPNATRASLPARKFTSFVAFEQLKIPREFGPRASRFRRNPAAATSSASSHVAARNPPLSRISGVVRRAYDPATSEERAIADLLVTTEDKQLPDVVARYQASSVQTSRDS